MDIFESLNSVLVDLFNDILNIEERALITEEFKDISVTDMHIIAANIANQERFLPPAYINDAGNNITEAAWSYFLPLIQGECNIRLHNGLPVHFKMQESVLK